MCFLYFLIVLFALSFLLIQFGMKIIRFGKPKKSGETQFLLEILQKN